MSGKVGTHCLELALSLPPDVGVGIERLLNAVPQAGGVHGVQWSANAGVFRVVGDGGAGCLMRPRAERVE